MASELSSFYRSLIYKLGPMGQGVGPIEELR